MSLGVLARFPNQYQVNTEIYQGPLDLLLQLIEKAELDITKLALAQVTDQYLNYLRSLNHLQTNEISLFVIIATKLLQIKSAFLLPKPKVNEDEPEELGDDLVQQLIEYKKVRLIAQWLANREAQNLRTYLRIADPPKMEGKIDLGNINLDDLMTAARKVFSQSIQDYDLQKQISRPTFSIRNKIQLIITRLQQEGNITFQSLIETIPSRVEIMTTFLAVLELIKQKQVDVIQESLFAEIMIIPSNTMEINPMIDSEFDDE